MKANDLVVDDRAALGPERGPGRYLVKEEEVERLPQHTVIATLRFLDAVQVRLEVFLRPEGGGVDALQHLAPFVTAPIRARGVEQLEVLQVRRVGHVRAAAQVDERPVRVCRDDLIGTEVRDAFELQRILRKATPGLTPIDLLSA
jgi:hypothetical protein